jgi:hypothetical protein
MITAVGNAKRLSLGVLEKKSVIAYAYLVFSGIA